ncbi:hypothetical protein [Brevibacillus laterosporus]|uniref:hypothetical protein n=1 Tax=Brevibacillus laterosporus TaxID=1465 RepID=UPI002654DE50|nr:hypothetical protein [Brevibacillus laterosporus]MDN9011171.1 hypothetical protein [Brevibacillus laterosporus]MDO0942194.1 hypothetical protein [Brevibacillus laterosporus]
MADIPAIFARYLDVSSYFLINPQNLDSRNWNLEKGDDSRAISKKREDEEMTPFSPDHAWRQSTVIAKKLA